MQIIKLLILFLFIFTSFSKTIFAKEKSASIFVYHRFGENSFPSTNIRLEQFKKHINELKRNNYNIIPIPEIINAYINNEELPKKTIGISIDDAFLSIYKKAWPLLKKNKIPFTIFVSTGPVNSGSKNYMNWKQIRKLVDSGVNIGNHTVNHLHLANETEETVRKEIEEANTAFLENLGFSPKIFAYPYGEYTHEIKNIVKEYNFKAAFGQQSGVLFDKIDMFELPRFAMNEKYGDIDRFKFAANSFGFHIKDIIPKTMLIKDINPPLLGFTLVNNIESKLNCYPSHNIKANLIKLGEKRIEVRFNQKFPKGRTRINCTTNDDGKWRWYGFQFINP